MAPLRAHARVAPPSVTLARRVVTGCETVATRENKVNTKQNLLHLRPLLRKNWTQSKLNCARKRPANFFFRGLL